MSLFPAFFRMTCSFVFRSRYIYIVLGLCSLAALFVASQMTYIRFAESVSAMLIFNALLPLVLMLEYYYALRIFFSEKKQGVMAVFYCSPAHGREIFWGKAIGLAFAAFVPALLIGVVGFRLMQPQFFAAMVSFRTAASVALVGAFSLVYSVIIGVVVLNMDDWRIPNLVVGVILTAQFYTMKFTQAAVRAHGMDSTLAGYSAAAALLAAAAAFLYSRYLSKSKILSGSL